MRNRIILFILAALLAIGCKMTTQKDTSAEPVVMYRDIRNETLADVANDLIRFGRPDLALCLVEGDSSDMADNIRARVYEATGEFRKAISLDIQGLRQYDDDSFFEGNWILWDMYQLCLRDTDVSISLLETERTRCPANYQVRLLLMKLHWHEDNLEEVVLMGKEFQEELPDMSQEVCFNYWMQDALDSLSKRNVINISTGGAGSNINI